MTTRTKSKNRDRREWKQLTAFDGEALTGGIPKIEIPATLPPPAPEPDPPVRQMDIFDFLNEPPREYNPLLAMPVCPVP